MGNSRIKNKKDEILFAIKQGVTIKDLSIKYGYKRARKFKEQLIKEGIIPEDGDFALQNGQLIKSESGENTGFKYELDGRTIVVIDSKSGSQHKFKLP